jgi:hypothetical protein
MCFVFVNAIAFPRVACDAAAVRSVQRSTTAVCVAASDVAGVSVAARFAGV